MVNRRSAWEHQVAEVADLVVWSTLLKPPTLGPGRLVCVDGRAGSGKSTLGGAVCDAAKAAGSAHLLHVDDMLDGWSGLPKVASSIDRDVLRPLAEGRAGTYRRYDWEQARFAEEHRVEPVDLLVLEGVGSGASAYADLVTTLVWVDAPPDLRLARGIARDGEGLREHWLRWMEDEDELFLQERTRDRADMLVDGTGDAEQLVVFA